MFVRRQSKYYAGAARARRPTRRRRPPRGASYAPLAPSARWPSLSLPALFSREGMRSMPSAQKMRKSEKTNISEISALEPTPIKSRVR